MSMEKDLAQVQITQAPRSGEMYRHYKGGLYAVVTSAIKEDTLEPMVVYGSIRKGSVWVRTLANFTETVTVDGVEVPRFKRETD
jgi:hypothetical protein